MPEIIGDTTTRIKTQELPLEPITYKYQTLPLQYFNLGKTKTPYEKLQAKEKEVQIKLLEDETKKQKDVEKAVKEISALGQFISPSTYYNLISSNKIDPNSLKGFAFDVLADPTTYASLGILPAIKIGGKKISSDMLSAGLKRAFSSGRYTPSTDNWFTPSENFTTTYFTKTWKDGKGKNPAVLISHKDYPGLAFELVLKTDANQLIIPNSFDIHFKTDLDFWEQHPEMKKMYFLEVNKALPEGATISTSGNPTKGGIHGLNRFKNNFGYQSLGTTELGNPMFLKRTTHIQGDDAVNMFKEYGGIQIPENSEIKLNILAYIPEARERYGLVGNLKISDLEIAESLYKQSLELGKDNGAVNSKGEPILLFRGDTRRYKTFREKPTPEVMATLNGTMDNSLGNLFLGQMPSNVLGPTYGLGPGEYISTVKIKDNGKYILRESNTGNAKTILRNDPDTKYVIPEESFYGFYISDLPQGSYPLNNRYGESVYKVPGKYMDSGVNDINAFVVKTPKVRDATDEITVLNDMEITDPETTFNWHLNDENKLKLLNYKNPNELRNVVANHYTNLLNSAKQNNEGLIKSKGVNKGFHTFRSEHDNYDYYALPNFNRYNIKHLLPHDLRVPRDWSNPNIYKMLIPGAIGIPLLKKESKNNKK